MGYVVTAGSLSFVLVIIIIPFVYVCMQCIIIIYRLIRYADVPEELMAEPSEAFKHIATDVEQQVCHVCQCMICMYVMSMYVCSCLCMQVAEHEQSRQGPPPGRVILIGHSFGSYIANILVPSLRYLPIPSLHRIAI